MPKKPKKKRTLKEKIVAAKDWVKNNKTTSILGAISAICFIALIVSIVVRVATPPREEITAEQLEQGIRDGSISEVIYNLADQDVSGLWDPDGDGNYTTYVTPYSSAGFDHLKEVLGEYPAIKFRTENSSYGGVSLFQGAAILLGIAFLIATAASLKIKKANEEYAREQLSDAAPKKKKKPKVAQAEIPDVRFADVAGCDEALEDVAEIREFLINPERFTRLGAKIPCGILMAGPPGCGKTLMAKAIAGESGAAFFTMSGSDFVEKYVGVGASRVRDLFESARLSAPAIVFIDEIDAVGKKRSGDSPVGDSETDRTLNQLLVEMDGFSATDNIIVIGATNRIDTLDPALLRPGRFDRHVQVDLPDKAGRLEILKVHARNKPLAEDIDLEHYATITAGMSGAQLENLMNEAAIFGARRNAVEITTGDMNAAFERIVAGAEKKGRILSEEEKRTTAYHEAGHAIVGHMLEGADKVSKISIISRGQALGYTLTLPESDRFLYTRQHLKDQLAMFLGGLVAEEMINDDNISTGPSNDLERATKMAMSMVMQFGMSDELGRRAFIQDNQSLTKTYSENKAQEIDSAVDDLLKEAHDTALGILTEYRDRLDQIADVLVNQEVVEGEEMEDLLDGCWKGYGHYEKEEKTEATFLATPEDEDESDDYDEDDDGGSTKKKRDRELAGSVTGGLESLKGRIAKKKKKKAAT